MFSISIPNSLKNFILATPPCQGVSLIGKNKRNEQFLEDPRNFLIFHAFDIIDEIEKISEFDTLTGVITSNKKTYTLIDDNYEKHIKKQFGRV